MEEQKEAATFVRPVRVVYLDEAEFKQRLSIDGELSEDERQEVKRAEAALRALGLHGGTGSLVDQANTNSTEGTAAFYDPDREAADGTGCLRVAVVGVDAAATAQLQDALETWVASRPDGAASSRTLDDRVQFDACDRGTTTATLTTDLASLPVFRASLVSVLVEGGADAATASCAASELIDRVPLLG